ncbi:uncharacterized protein [Littorina saxatilis]|uniref:uncharacterized protein n=1 Tax=Littorina saxatilis TaxID=31220 RepID=UPI0038B5A8E9
MARLESTRRHVPNTKHHSSIKPCMCFFVRKKKWLVLVLVIQLGIRSASGAACEKEGPCEIDHYCSEQRNVCRSCDHIAEHYCHNRTVILQRFTACDAFCFKQKLAAASTDLAIREQVIKNQTELIDQLNNTVTSIDKGLGWRYITLIILCPLFFLWGSVATWMLTKDKVRKAPACRRSPKAHEPAELTASLQTGDPLGIDTPAPVDEEGYGTGNSGSSTPLLVRPSIPVPDPEGESSDVRPPYVVSGNGQSVHCNPTTDDNGPPQIAL